LDEGFNVKKYKIALTIAGSDCSGGAGIQADLKTFAALGCYGASALTALTAQNTQGVQAVFPVSAKFVKEQLKSIFDDLDVRAIKTGMLFSAEIIEMVVGILVKHKLPLVVDPVMIAQSGDPLIKTNAVSIIKNKLLPLATIITPNIRETEYLLKYKLNNKQDIQQAAKELCDMGPQAVLIKGGHLQGKLSNDCLYIKKEKSFYWFSSKRVVTKNNHGTGCTLSAAIAALMAQGHGLFDSVNSAKKYIYQALLAGNRYKIGHGHGPVHHFYKEWS
jgi:hydroxymethylpyrimidine/phosphomethylpyrimidine kinase